MKLRGSFIRHLILLCVVLLLLYPAIIIFGLYDKLYTYHLLHSSNKDVEASMIANKPLKASSTSNDLIGSKEHLMQVLNALGDKPDIDDYKSKREYVKEMMKNCWEAYTRYGFGENEVNVLLKTGYNNPAYGSKGGITIIDSADTLFLMGLFEEYVQARKWIADKFYFHKGLIINLFEYNIRVIGGLLSLYHLTNDTLYLNKVKTFASSILTAFQNDQFPRNKVYFQSSLVTSFVGSTTCNLAEIGTLHLEFCQLSQITNNPAFCSQAQNIRSKLYEIMISGHYPLPVNYNALSRTSHSSEYSIGSGADSFYEYLLKSYVMDKTQYQDLDFFLQAIQRLEDKILAQTKAGYWYFFNSNDKNQEMEHLACFTGGMYALAYLNIEHQELKMKFLNKSKSITETCYKSCINSKTGLCPDSFNPETIDTNKFYENDSPYLLRPELMESLFYLYRVTGNDSYREIGWNLIQNVHKHARVSTGGYSSVRSVNNEHVSWIGVQESYFMAETIKYAYLLFSDESFLPLDKWVFNTEAHPLPIKLV